MQRILITLLLISSLSATAKTNEGEAGPKILVYGVDDLKDCAAQISALQNELLTLHYPNNWRIGIACSPIGWDTLRKIADFQNTESAFTNFRKRSTVVNGEIFNRFRSDYRHVLAQELGHITCNCADEGRAEKLAYTLERVETNDSIQAEARPVQK